MDVANKKNCTIIWSILSNVGIMEPKLRYYIFHVIDLAIFPLLYKYAWNHTKSSRDNECNNSFYKLILFNCFWCIMNNLTWIHHCNVQWQSMCSLYIMLHSSVIIFYNSYWLFFYCYWSIICSTKWDGLIEISP
jgi:hypothetical protein